MTKGIRRFEVLEDCAPVVKAGDVLPYIGQSAYIASDLVLKTDIGTLTISPHKCREITDDEVIRKEPPTPKLQTFFPGYARDRAAELIAQANATIKPRAAGLLEQRLRKALDGEDAFTASLQLVTGKELKDLSITNIEDGYLEYGVDPDFKFINLAFVVRAEVNF